MFYIYGEAQRPGPYKIERGMTVLQALAQGGGPTNRGSANRLRLNRTRRGRNRRADRTPPDRPDPARRRALRAREPVLKGTRHEPVPTILNPARATGTGGPDRAGHDCAGAGLGRCCGPPTYTARAPVLVDVRTDPVGVTSQYNPLVTPAFMATQIDIVKSERVAERAVQMLPADQSPLSKWGQEAKKKPAPQAWLAQRCSSAWRSSRRARATSSTSPGPGAARPRRPGWPMPSRRPTWTSAWTRDRTGQEVRRFLRRAGQGFAGEAGEGPGQAVRLPAAVGHPDRRRTRRLRSRTPD